MKILKQSDIKPLRDKLLKRQNGLCALCGHEVDNPCLDHSHKKNGGTGLVRSVICRGENALLGKIENNARRNKITNLIIFLRDAANYLEKEHTEYIHPTEIKLKKLKKSSYNKVEKYFNGYGINGKGKFPEYPKSGKLTVRLGKAFKKSGIKPEFYNKPKTGHEGFDNHYPKASQ
jgi:hypothetical protein